MSAYRWVLWLAAPLVLAYTLSRALRDGGVAYLRQRFGVGLKKLDRPIWFHCASVGEVVAASPLFELVFRHYPEVGIVVTTNTPTGREVLLRRFGDHFLHAYLPLDYTGPVRRFYQRIAPRCALIFETELWPQLFARCHTLGIPLVIINGRLSRKTMDAPSVVRSQYMQSLRHVAAILTRSDLDRQRFIALGALPERVITLGNIKFAQTGNAAQTLREDPIGRRYWLVASTHDDEEWRIARFWAKGPRTDHLLVIAPRHPERREAILKRLDVLHMRIAVRSRGEPVTRETELYLADTLGEMPAFMTHAELVFLGGSLIERGGQNILEPARLGKAIVVGPHMDNFKEETEILLERDGLVMVQNDKRLHDTVVDLLNDARRRTELGENAKQVIDERADIAHRYFQHLNELGVFA